MKRCPKHGCDLLPGKIEIRFGMPPAPPKGYFEAKDDLFPFANSWEIGGCVIKLGIDDESDINYCAECKAAEIVWQEQNEMEEFWKV